MAQARALTPHDPVFLPLFGGLVALRLAGLLAGWGALALGALSRS